MNPHNPDHWPSVSRRRRRERLARKRIFRAESAEDQRAIRDASLLDHARAVIEHFDGVQS